MEPLPNAELRNTCAVVMRGASTDKLFEKNVGHAGRKNLSLVVTRLRQVD